VGIVPELRAPGFERFTIKPYIFDELTFVAGELNSIKGVIKSSWKKSAGAIELEVMIPPNSTATVYVPAMTKSRITESDRPVAQLQELTFLKSEECYAVYELPSGSYRFRADWAS
jgi:alpha-L-rhamnosidase